MKGWKTLIFNLLMVIIGAVLPWLGTVDWTQYVDPKTAVVLMAVINMLLRLWTNSPVGRK